MSNHIHQAHIQGTQDNYTVSCICGWRHPRIVESIYTAVSIGDSHISTEIKTFYYYVIDDQAGLT